MREDRMISLVDVISSDLGPPEKQESGRPWWNCPFHGDGNPSLCIIPPNGRKERWICFGCRLHGDAIDFIRELHQLSFPEAKHKIQFLSSLKGKGNGTPRCQDAKATRKTHPPRLAPCKPQPPADSQREMLGTVVDPSRLAIWKYPEVLKWLFW